MPLPQVSGAPAPRAALRVGVLLGLLLTPPCMTCAPTAGGADGNRLAPKAPPAADVSDDPFVGVWQYRGRSEGGSTITGTALVWKMATGNYRVQWAGLGKTADGKNLSTALTGVGTLEGKVLFVAWNEDGVSGYSIIRPLPREGRGPRRCAARWSAGPGARGQEEWSFLAAHPALAEEEESDAGLTPTNTPE